MLDRACIPIAVLGTAVAVVTGDYIKECMLIQKEYLNIILYAQE